MAKSITPLQPQFAGGDIPVSLIGFARGGYVNPQLMYKLAQTRKEIANGMRPVTGAHKYADKVRAMIAKKGNMVPGAPPANPMQDNVLVPMQTGEYVIPTPAVKKIGKHKLDGMVQSALGTVTPPSGTPATGYRHGGYYAGRGYGQYQQIITPTEGGPGGPGNVAVNPNLFYGEGFSPSGSGFPSIRGGFQHPAGLENRSFTTSPFWQNTPGMPWSPTMIPTTYNPQGYPRAVPVFSPSPDYGSAGPHPHTPPKSES